MKTLGIIKLTDFMCDNKSTLTVFDNDGFVAYRLHGGHSTSGTPFAITNLDRDGLLPDEIHDSETVEQFVHRVAKVIIKERLSKAVNKIILSKTFN